MRRRRPQRQPIRVTAGGQIALSLLVFAVVAFAGTQAAVLDANVAVMRAIRAVFPVGSIDVVSLVLVVGSTPVSLALLVGVGAWLYWRGQRLTALSLALILVAIGCEVLFKATLWHPRMWSEFVRDIGLYPLPEIKSVGPILLISPFPSGHVLRAAFVALAASAVFGRMLTKWGAISLRAAAGAVVAVVVLGVLYLGWHWPTDVIGGLALATAAFAPVRWAMARESRGAIPYRLTRQPDRWADRG